MRLMLSLFLSGLLAAAAQPAWTGTVITADEQGHSISIVDTRAWTAQTVNLPVAPHNVQSSADRRYVYVTGMQEMDMAHMDMSSMSPQEMQAMMKSMQSGLLVALDLERRNGSPVFSIPIGVHPAHVVVDRENRFAYVTVSGEDVVKVVDVARKAIVGAIAAGNMPHGLRMSPDERTIYVADMNGGTVSVIDVAQRKLAFTVPVGSTPVQVAVSPDGSTVYATLAGEDAVAVIDASSRKVRAKIPVGPNPMQLYASPDGRRVYVANQGTKDRPGHTVSVIDAASGSVVATVQVPVGAHGVVVTPDSSTVFVTDAFNSTLSEIDARTLEVKSIAVGAGPNGVTLGP